jgi:hypothetical protein
MKIPALVTAAILIGVPAAAHAADPRYPDWPCNQIKVPELSVAAMWAGPPIDDVGGAWQHDPAVRDLVERLAARRTPMEDARKAISGYITGSDKERQQKARLLFAGLFATLNHERSEVMDGIERFARRQKEFADQIRAEAEKARELQNGPDHDQGKVDQMANDLDWQTRIYDERRQTIGYVCEVPVTIEQRLFALARAIQEAIE